MQNSFNISISRQEEVEKKDKRRSFLLSSFAHLVLLLLLLLPFARYNEPNEQFSGILVNFGDIDGGSLEIADSKVENEPTNASIKEKSPTTPPQKPEQKPKASSIVASKITTEKESKIIATDKKTKPQKTTENKETNTTKETVESKTLKTEEDIRKEQEAIKREQEKRRQEQEYENAKSKFDNVFSSSKGTGDNNETAGNPNGAFDQENLSTQSYGTGDIGKELGDRQVLYSPKIVDKSQKTGIVVVKICVDNSGKVSSASFTQKGSTTNDNQLVDLAIRSAKKYKFSKSDQASQCGKISIHFKLK